MTLLVKLGLGVLGGGSVAAGGYGVYELIKPRTISDQLKWNGKELMDIEKEYANTEDVPGKGLWHDLFEKYNHTSNTTDKFKNGDAVISTINEKSKLREKCKEVLTLPLTKENENNLKQAGFWCVRNSEKLNQQ